MYQIKVIEVTEPMSEHSKKPWFRYIISNDQNTITGYRCGSERDVKQFARECINSLNTKYPSGQPRHVNPVQINNTYL